jgi:putative peptide zinc metalloprotease protein
VKTYDSPAMEVVVDGDKAVVHDRRADRYFATDPGRLAPGIRQGLIDVQPRVSQRQALLAVGVTCFLGATAVMLSRQHELRHSPLAFTVAVVALYGVVSVAAHEGAHIAALRYCGRRHDRVGFKMHFLVLPSFYVRMNQSLLLSQSERVFVHIAGVLANLALSVVLMAVNALWIHSAAIHDAVTLICVSIFFNCLPLLNSDGYRILLAVTQTHELKERTKNPTWVIYLKLASVAVVVVYTWSWIGPMI